MKNEYFSTMTQFERSITLQLNLFFAKLPTLLLPHVFVDTVRLILQQIDLNRNRDIPLSFGAMKYLFNLFGHKTFALDLLERGALQQMLHDCRLPVAATDCERIELLESCLRQKEVRQEQLIQIRDQRIAFLEKKNELLQKQLITARMEQTISLGEMQSSPEQSIAEVRHEERKLSATRRMWTRWIATLTFRRRI